MVLDMELQRKRLARGDIIQEGKSGRHQVDRVVRQILSNAASRTITEREMIRTQPLHLLRRLDKPALWLEDLWLWVDVRIAMCCPARSANLGSGWNEMAVDGGISSRLASEVTGYAGAHPQSFFNTRSQVFAAQQFGTSYDLLDVTECRLYLLLKFCKALGVSSEVK